MKRIKKGIIGILIVAVAFIFINKVSAATPHNFSFNAIDYNILEDSGTGDVIVQNGDVEPGQIFQLDLMYNVGDPTFLSAQIGFIFDYNLVEPVLDEGNVYYELAGTTYNGGIFPSKSTIGTGRNQTNWSYNPNYYNHPELGNGVWAILKDSTYEKPLATSGRMVSMWFKVKEDAAPGSIIKFEYSHAYTTITGGYQYTSNSYQLNVFGDMSGDNSLSGLEVQHDSQLYDLTPTFVPGSTAVTDFRTVVPNNVTNIDLSAIKNNEYANIVSGPGNKTLNVGENRFPIVVNAQNGDSQIYYVTVYRLNNNATLSSMELTNGINLNFNPSTLEYNLSVPYATNQTTLSATLNDSKASIVGSLGLWSLSNYGSTINTKTVTVEAENCKIEYNSVSGNSCTSSDYIINITRANPSTNNYLSMIKINDVDMVGFNKNIKTYNLDDVRTEVTSIKIEGIIEDIGKATIVSGNNIYSLNIGDNQFKIIVRAENGDQTEYVINVKRLSNDANLKSLVITSTPNGTLSPTFSPTFYSDYTYRIGPDVTTINIAAIPNHDNAIITEALGTIAVVDGQTLTITVTSENGNVRAYKIKIERDKSTNADLGTLIVDGWSLTPEFASNKTLYNVSVPSNIDAVNIDATVVDNRAVITVGHLGSKTLNYGVNTYQVRVTAEAGNIKDYTINITRAKKSNANLSDLTINGVTINGFSSSIISYDLGEVDNLVTSLTVGATAADSDATVTGTGNADLKIGENIIKVKVVAHDGVTDKEYQIKVVRKKSENANLSDLKVSGITIDGFASDKTEYYLTVENNVTYLNLLPVVSHTAGATYIVTGNSSFSTKTVNTVKITVTAEAGNTKDYFIYVTRKPSDNNYLSSISLNRGTLAPTFDKTHNTYTVSVSREIDTITINGVKEDSEATIVNIGTRPLVVGNNIFQITVTSESGIANVYTIEVTREESTNNNLKNITINGVQIEGFVIGKTSYTINRPHTLNDVIIEAEVDGVGASYVILDKDNNVVSGTLNLVTGLNTFTIEVTAENGSKKLHTININRATSSDNTLKSLSIDGYELNETFNPLNLNYTLTVPSSVSEINVLAVANDPKNKGVVGTGIKTLHNGTNIINVVVTAENNETKTYKITVVREFYTNAYLSNITISGGYTISFDKETYGYTLTVPNYINELTIEGIKEHDTSIVTGGGLVHLITTNPNVITLTVTAQDGVTKNIYTLTVTREKNDDNTLSSIKENNVLLEGFDPAKNYYEITVPNSKTSLNLQITPTVGTTTYQVTNNENFTTSSSGNLVTITATAENGLEKVYQIRVFREKSSNNYLRGINLSTGLLNPIFNKETNEYTVEVPRSVNNITITPIKDDPAADVIMNPLTTKDLELDDNIFTITVTSEDGQPNIYIVNVVRKRSNNNYLSNISLDGTTITGFNKNTTSYTVNVEHNVNSIVLAATTEWVGAGMVMTDENGDAVDGNLSLKSGINKYTITVTAEDGTTKSYTVIINKKLSNDSSLKSLSILETILNETFEPTKLSYTATVAYSVTEINVDAEANDTKAKSVIGLGNKTLITGPNTIEIEVTAEDNTKTKYSIIVTRAYNNNPLLSSITLSGGYHLTPIFSSIEENYTVDVSNATTNLLLTIIKQDPIATYVITNDGVITGSNLTLKTGLNKIKIVVTAEDKVTTKTYNIDINRAKSNDNTLKSLAVVGQTLTPSFNAETLSYDIIVEHEITDLTVNALANHPDATALISGNQNLQVGENKVTITVTPESGVNPRVYEINVTRKPSPNNYLFSLTAIDNNSKNYIEVFNKFTKTYRITVSNEIDELTLEGVPEVEGTLVEGTGKRTLVVGEQAFRITVTSYQGIENNYDVIVTREKNKNYYLSELNVDKGVLTPVFDKDTYSYTVELESNVDKIFVTALPEESTTTVTGTGEYILKTGSNPITVTTKSEFGESKSYVIVVTRKASSNNNLSSLIPSVGTLNPEFSKNTTNYTVLVENNITEIDFTATVEDTGKATVTITGPSHLLVGDNNYVVKVVAEDNTPKEYNVKVTRKASSNNLLEYIKVNGEDIEDFVFETETYTLTVSNNIKDAIIDAKALDNTANITGRGTYALSTQNDNIIKLTVTAENGNIKVYTVTITREKSTNNYLKQLVVNEGTLTPVFDKDVTSYTINIPFDYNKLTINALPEDESSAVEIDGNNNFIVGTNNVVITVIPESGEPRNYNITVIRSNEANNYLKSLEIRGKANNLYTLSPVFNKATLKYKITIPKTETELNITATKEFLASTVTGDGKVEITSLPMEHKVVVRSSSGITREYIITVEKEKSNDTTLEAITVSAGVINFNPSTRDYTVTVSSINDKITIDATKKDGQTLSGIGEKTLNYGNNQVTITVVAEDGTIGTYRINVIREEPKDNTLKNILLNVGSLTPTFSPETLSYNVNVAYAIDSVTVTPVLESSHAKLEIKKDGEEYTEVSNLVYNDLIVGDNIVKIKVTNSDLESTEYIINIKRVAQNKITSVNYGHTIDDDYILTVVERTTLEQMKNQLDNPNEQLKIYLADGTTEVTSGYVGTGMYVKLIIDGEVVDSKQIVVLGDTSGDGEVNIIDATTIISHILEIRKLNNAYLLAADSNKDSDVNIIDATRIVSHILEINPLF